MRIVAKLVLLWAGVVSAGIARADVDAFIPGPPKSAAFDDASIGPVIRELRMERDEWLNRLKQIRGARVRALKQGLDVDCFAEVEQKLKIEGYTLYQLKDMSVYYHEKKEQMIDEFVNALGGNISKKIAVRVMPACWVSVAPRGDLKPNEARRTWIEVLQGLTMQGLGNVKAYLYREFPKPVGFVCVEIDLSHGAKLEHLVDVFNCSLGAALGSSMSRDAIDELLERTAREGLAEDRANNPPPAPSPAASPKR